MSAGQLGGRTLSAVRLVILAYLLPLPEMGLFGVGVIVIELIDRLSQTGFRQALIQRPSDIQDHLGTAWVAQIIRGLILSLVIFFSANAAESFFEKPGVASLLTVLAILPLIQGIKNVGLVYLHRELRFKKIVAIQVATTATDLCVSVTLACFWPFAISLVIGRLVAELVAFGMSFILEKRWAPFEFSLKHCRELYSFGFWILASSVLSFVVIRGGDFVIGKVLTLEDLAVYQVGYALVSIPVMAIMGVIGSTTFSAYSRIQNDPARLADAFLRVFAFSSYVAVFSVVGACALGKDFVESCLKPEYALAATILPFLAVWAACRGLGHTNSVLFQATGRPAVAIVFQVLMVAMFVLLIPIAIEYQLIGVAIGLAVIGLTAQIGRYITLSMLTDATLGQVFRRILIPLLVGIVSYGVTAICIIFINDQMHLLRFITGLIVLSTVYPLSMFFVDQKFDFGITDFALARYPMVKGKWSNFSGDSQTFTS